MSLPSRTCPPNPSSHSAATLSARTSSGAYPALNPRLSTLSQPAHEPLRHSSWQLRCNVSGIYLLPIPTRAHHDVNGRRLTDPAQRNRVAAEADVCRVADGSTADPAEPAHLVDCQLDVVD